MNFCRDQQESEEAIDDLNGCRKGENTVKTPSLRTGGTILFMTCSNFICSLTPILRTESPTEVLLRLVATIWSTPEAMKYFKRFCISVGYDMWCNMLKTMLGAKMVRMFWEGVEDAQLILFVFTEFGLHRVHIDAYHCQFHKEDTCAQSFGFLNAHNPKFGAVHCYQGPGHQQAKHINSQVCEHWWRKFNEMKFTKSLCGRKFDFTLLLILDYHNLEMKHSLEKRGYTWEPVENWEAIHSIGLNDFRKFVADCLVEDRNHIADKGQWWYTCWDQLQVRQGQQQVGSVKRAKFSVRFADSYYNVWADDNEQWKVNEEFAQFMQAVHARAVNAIRCNIQDIKLYIHSGPSVNSKRIKYSTVLDEYIAAVLCIRKTILKNYNPDHPLYSAKLEIALTKINGLLS